MSLSKPDFCFSIRVYQFRDWRTGLRWKTSKVIHFTPSLFLLIHLNQSIHLFEAFPPHTFVSSLSVCFLFSLTNFTICSICIAGLIFNYWVCIMFCGSLMQRKKVSHEFDIYETAKLRSQTQLLDSFGQMLQVNMLQTCSITFPRHSCRSGSSNYREVLQKNVEIVSQLLLSARTYSGVISFI